jgi:hypothetical protein
VFEVSLGEVCYIDFLRLCRCRGCRTLKKRNRSMSMYKIWSRRSPHRDRFAMHHLSLYFLIGDALQTYPYEEIFYSIFCTLTLIYSSFSVSGTLYIYTVSKSRCNIPHPGRPQTQWLYSALDSAPSVVLTK